MGVVTTRERSLLEKLKAIRKARLKIGQHEARWRRRRALAWCRLLRAWAREVGAKSLVMELAPSPFDPFVVTRRWLL